MSDRVDAVMVEVPPIDPGEPFCVPTASGLVAFTSITERTEGASRWVEVTVADPACGDPTFRVFNPPALVPDPEGDVERGGVRYRNDPLSALAETVAANGGYSSHKVREL